MPFRLFHDFFPAIAERETRTLIVPPGSTKAALPVGEYGVPRALRSRSRARTLGAGHVR
ncbi:MAG: hypothetical protein AB7U23_14505 [Dehalococcoidia bacterium]